MRTDVAGEVAEAAPALEPPAQGTAALPAPRRRLSIAGRQKAAVLLVALGQERAAELFAHLREEEIESLSLEMAKLREVGPETTEAVLAEALENAPPPDHAAHRGYHCPREVLE